MTIKITWKTVAVVASAALTVAAAYYLAKEDAKEREKIRKHKDEALEGRDLTKEMNDASVRNEKLDPEDRAVAFKVLEEKKIAVDNAYYISDFDKALEEFDRAVSLITQDDSEAALACLIVYKDRLKKRENSETYRRQLERDRERNETELEKAKTIAKAITSVAQNPSDLNNLFKQASEIAIRR